MQLIGVMLFKHKHWMQLPHLWYEDQGDEQSDTFNRKDINLLHCHSYFLMVYFMAFSSCGFSWQCNLVFHLSLSKAVQMAVCLLPPECH